MHTTHAFSPRGILKHPHAQSFLASFKPRRWAIYRQHPQLKHSERIILETSEGRLAADVNQHPAPKGHAVLIHGWEGASDSVYLVSLGTYLYRRGYTVSRLNLRDHGNTYHLNEGPFHGFLIHEVAEAVKQLCGLYGNDIPNVLAGFSMGGNFALRVSGLAKRLNIPLKAVFAISPAVRPISTMQALAAGPKLYHHYFRKKWRKSLRAKQAAWPAIYNFEEVLGLNSLDEMTDYFVREGLLPVNDRTTYLEGYRVDKDVIEQITVPTYILTAADDPVIPLADITALPDSKWVNTTVLKHGGHCGFINGKRLTSYADRWVFNTLQRILNED